MMLHYNALLFAVNMSNSSISVPAAVSWGVFTSAILSSAESTSNVFSPLVRFIWAGVKAADQQLEQTMPDLVSNWTKTTS